MTIRSQCAPLGSHDIPSQLCRSGLGVRAGVAALLSVLAACSGISCSGGPRLSAKSTPTVETSAHPCEVARARRAEAAELLRQRRPVRTERILDDADALCPSSSRESLGARERIRLLLGDATSDGKCAAQLLDLAMAARAQRHPDAQLLADRALAQIESNARSRARVTPLTDQEPELVRWLQPAGDSSCRTASPRTRFDHHVLRLFFDRAEVQDVFTGERSLLPPFVNGRAYRQLDSTCTKLSLCINDELSLYDINTHTHARLPFDCREPLAFDATGRLVAVTTPSSTNLGSYDLVVLGMSGKEFFRTELGNPHDGAHLEFSPDSQKVMVFGKESVGVESPLWVSLWDLRSRSNVLRRAHKDSCGSAVFRTDLDGRFVAWLDGLDVQIFDFAQHRLLPQIPYLPECHVAAFGFHPDEASLVTVSNSGTVCVRPLESSSPRIIHKPRAMSQSEVDYWRRFADDHGGGGCGHPPLGLTIGPHAGSLSFGRQLDRRGELLIDGRSAAPVLVKTSTRPPEFTGSFEAIERRDARNPFAAFVLEDELVVVDAQQARQTGTISLPYVSNGRRHLQLEPYGRSIYIEAKGFGARQVSLETGKELAVIPPVPSVASRVRIDGNQVRFDMDDGSNIILDRETWKRIAKTESGTSVERDAAAWESWRRSVQPTGESSVRAVTVDQETFALVNADFRVAVKIRRAHMEAWRPGGRDLWSLRFETQPTIPRVVFSGDGRRVFLELNAASDKLRGNIQVLDAQTGILLGRVATGERARHLVPSDDGSLIAMMSRDSIQVHSTKTGALVRSIVQGVATWDSMLLANDGSIVTTDSYPRIYRADAPNVGVELAAPFPYELKGAIGFTADNRHVVITSVGGASLFDVPSGTWTSTIVPTANATIVISANGTVEIQGDRAEARRALGCRVGDELYPFELCQDRVLAP